MVNNSSSGLAELQRHASTYLGAALEKRAFDAASNRERLSGWLTSGTSANAELRRALSRLRDRSRDLARNDPYVSRALAVIRSNVVGTGVRAQLDGSSQIEAAWKRWAESTRCDADGRHNLYGLQSLAMRAIAESGEVLLRMRPRRVSDGLEIPMQLQLLEADHLDTSKDGDAERTGHTIVQGVEFNAIGRRVAYWVFRTHPGDARSSASRQSVRVSADRMLHLFRVDRPGQVRGVPWAAPIAVRAHELKDYEDAQLLRQKIAACFAVFREDTNVEMEPGPAAQAAQSEEGELGRDSVEPGMIEDLPAGKKVTFAQPPGVGGYDEFVTRQLRAVASGFGVSYEALTGDYSTVNFASGRMGHVEFQRNVTTWQNDLMVMQLCRPVWAWFEEAAELAGVRNEGLDPSWILPRREMFDPTREIPALIQQVRGGMTSLSDVIRAQGDDPSEVFDRLAGERKRLDELKLTTESDPAQAKEWRMPDEPRA